MERHNLPIEDLPFFEGFHGTGKAIVDVKRFEEWLEESQAVELMSPRDEKDRRKALGQLERGETRDLGEAIKEW